MRLHTITRISLALILATSVSTPNAFGQSADGEQRRPPDQVHVFDSLDGLVLAFLNGDTPPEHRARIVSRDGVARFEYRRRGFPILAHHTATLTGFEFLEMRVRGKRGSTYLIVIEDRDGASFQYRYQPSDETWHTLRLQPHDFTADPDNDPRLRAQIDAERMAGTIAIVDVSSPFLQLGRSWLELDEVRIQYAALPYILGDWVIDGTERLEAPLWIDGDIRINPGGRLDVAAGRWIVNGDFEVRGALGVQSTTIQVQSGFEHEHQWRVGGAGEITIADSLIDLAHALEVDPSDSSRFRLDGVKTNGVMTVTSRDQASIEIREALAPGEFIICNACPFTAEESDHFLLWLILDDSFTANDVLELPNGRFIDSWSSIEDRRVQIQNAEGVMWGIITAPGAEGVIRDSELLAVASVFAGPGETRLRGFRTGAAPPGGRLAAGGRDISFVNTSVTAWNFYTTGGHDLVIDDAEVGEAWGLDGEGSVTLRHVLLDGSGGTLQARGQTRFLIENSQILPQVVARDEARMVIRYSVLHGALSTSDAAHVSLVGTEVRGAISQGGRSRIESDD